MVGRLIFSPTHIYKLQLLAHTHARVRSRTPLLHFGDGPRAQMCQTPNIPPRALLSVCHSSRQKKKKKKKREEALIRRCAAGVNARTRHCLSECLCDAPGAGVRGPGPRLSSSRAMGSLQALFFACITTLLCGNSAAGPLL